MKTDLFQSCGHCWVFQICWHIECSTFTASSFWIWKSSARIPSPPSALPHRVLLIISLSPGYTEIQRHPLHTVPRLDLISWMSPLSPGDSEGPGSLLCYFHWVTKCQTYLSNWTTATTWTFNKWKVENNYILTWWVKYEGIHGILDYFVAIVPNFEIWQLTAPMRWNFFYSTFSEAVFSWTFLGKVHFFFFPVDFSLSILIFLNDLFLVDDSYYSVTESQYFVCKPLRYSYFASAIRVCGHHVAVESLEPVADAVCFDGWTLRRYPFSKNLLSICK